MSDLNKAIRAAAYTVDRDKLHAALAVVLDRHVHTGDDDVYIGPKVFWRCSQCGGLGGRWCDEVSAIARVLGVSGEDRPEPPPAPERQWAVEHPDVRLSVHRSEWSVLYTLSKLPGGRIVVRDAPDQPWRPETACLCGSAKPEVGHLDGCPDTSEAVTPEGTP